MAYSAEEHGIPLRAGFDGDETITYSVYLFIALDAP